MRFYGGETGLVDEIVWNGTQRVRQIAAETMKEVRKAMGLDRAIVRLRRGAERRSRGEARQKT